MITVRWSIVVLSPLFLDPLLSKGLATETKQSSRKFGAFMLA